MNRQKGIAPILIIILIAVAVGGYLLYQKQLKSVSVSQSSPSPVASPVASSSAEIANWKTYTNIQDGYSMKYRQDFVITKRDFWTIFKSPVAAKGGGYPDEDWFDLAISVKDNPNNQTALEYVNEYADSTITESLKRVPNSDTNSELRKFYNTRANNIRSSFKNYSNGIIDGIIGDTDGYENPNTAVIFSKNKKIYIFSLLGGPNTGTPPTKTAEKIFQQILSTFKFTQ